MEYLQPQPIYAETVPDSLWLRGIGRCGSGARLLIFQNGGVTGWTSWINLNG
jgi:hypothetical protein